MSGSDNSVINIQRTNTILYCRRWQETVAFYREVFDFPISYQTDWFVEVQLTPHSYLSIADESRSTMRSVEGQGVTLSWQVANVHEIHAVLVERHIAVTQIRKKWGAYLFYLYDPEGHRIELWQPATASLP